MHHPAGVTMKPHPDRRSTDLAPALIPVAISARHVHLTPESVERLFGSGHSLTVHAPLSQPGQFAAQETVTLVGPRGRLAQVRVVGPPRQEDQAEISRSDAYTLGLDPPIRESGQLTDTPGLTIEGPAGQVTLTHGAICALRHIHMTPVDADVLGLKDQDRVEVVVESPDRRLIFGDVVVRVASDFRLELHLDTDEGNAAGLRPGADGMLLAPIAARARVLKREWRGERRS
jgi:acetate kinase